MYDKKNIRKQILERRDALSLEEITQKSSSILDKLLKVEAVQTASTIFTYVSFSSEVDTHQLITYCLEHGKSVYAPRVLASGLMEFYQVQSLEELVPSKYGILEPVPKVPGYFGTREDEVMIMPGVAFDREKNRIGYGVGFYDRYLEKYDKGKCLKIALCYELQMMDAIEADPLDKKVDCIVTENGMY